MLHRHDIEDKTWNKINKNLPGSKGYKGRNGVDNRKFINAVLWILRSALERFATRIWGLEEYTQTIFKVEK